MVTDIDVNNLRAVLRGLRHKGLSWEIPISFLRFLRHHDRDWPCHTGYFRSLPLLSSPWIPPKLLGSFLFCGSRPRPAWTRIDLFLALLEWLVHGPRLAKRLGGTQSPFVRCVLDGLYSSGSCSPPITSRLLPHYSCKPSYSPIGHLVSVWTDLALFITIHRLQITGVPFKSRDHACDRGIKH